MSDTDNISSSNIDTSDNITEELTKLLGNIESKNIRVSENNHAVSVNSESSNDLCQVRADILKLLDMVNELKSEVRNISCGSEVYQESLDKILSVKLDELSVKVDNRINDLSRFVNNTRNVAISKNK